MITDFESLPAETAINLSLLATEAAESNGEFAHWRDISVRDTIYLIRDNPSFLYEGEREKLFYKLLDSQDPATKSWGEYQVTPHSALVDTLEMVRLLIDLPNSSDFQQIIEDGWGAAMKLLARSSVKYYPKHETVGLELIVPPLIEYIAIKLRDPEIPAEELRSFTPEQRYSHTYDALPLESGATNYYTYLKKEQAKKLELMRKLTPSGKRYFPPNTTAAHSFEAAGNMLRVGALSYDSEDIQGILDYKTNDLAGVALSPAATIEAIILLKEMGMDVPTEYTSYVEKAFKAHDRLGVPGVFPFRNTDNLWIGIYPLLSDDKEILQDKSFVKAYEKIISKIKVVEGKGIPWDNAFDITDLDDTVLALLYGELVRDAGGKVPEKLNYKLVNYFIENGALICFKGELTPSPSHLYHTLFYLDRLRKSIAREPRPEVNPLEVEHLYNMALMQINDIVGGDVFSALDDKWNAEDNYVFFRACNTLLYENPELIKAMFYKVIDSQINDDKHINGGFGTYLYRSPLVSATSHAYLSFDTLYERITSDPVLSAAYGEKFIKHVKGALITTENHLYLKTVVSGEDGRDEPRVWIAKNVYSSPRMDQALRIRVHDIMFRRRKLPETPDFSKEVKKSRHYKSAIIDNTDRLWTGVGNLGRERSNQKNTRRIAINMYKGLLLDAAGATPFAADPPVFNKLIEYLAEQQAILPDIDQAYAQGLREAADPANWEKEAYQMTDDKNSVKQLMKLTMKHIALLGLDARDKLENDPYRLDWEDIYHKAVDSNYLQEWYKGRIDQKARVTADPDFDDKDIIKDYLYRYGETSALGVALVGMIGHRYAPLTQDIIDFMRGEDFKLITGISRLVQDINQVDPTERVNAGIWLKSRSTGLSIEDTKKLLTRDYSHPVLHEFNIAGKADERKDISRRLKEVYVNYYKGVLEDMAEHYKQGGSPEGHFIAKIIENMLEVNELILQFKEQGTLI